jgi:hypothetical protein
MMKVFTGGVPVPEVLVPLPVGNIPQAFQPGKERNRTPPSPVVAPYLARAYSLALPWRE